MSDRGGEEEVLLRHRIGDGDLDRSTWRRQVVCAIATSHVRSGLKVQGFGSLRTGFT